MFHVVDDSWTASDADWTAESAVSRSMTWDAEEAEYSHDFAVVCGRHVDFDGDSRFVIQDENWISNSVEYCEVHAELGWNSSEDAQRGRLRKVTIHPLKVDGAGNCTKARLDIYGVPTPEGEDAESTTLTLLAKVLLTRSWEKQTLVHSTRFWAASIPDSVALDPLRISMRYNEGMEQTVSDFVKSGVFMETDNVDAVPPEEPDTELYPPISAVAGKTFVQQRPHAMWSVAVPKHTQSTVSQNSLVNLIVFVLAVFLIAYFAAMVARPRDRMR